MLKTQVIDVSRSFVVTDPEAFMENLMSTGQEDAPERLLPIVAYEGYNFLPTVYGQRSYFDITPKLDIGNLPARCDKLLLYQFADYSNCLIALCENGIYTNAGKVAATSWDHIVSVTAPAEGFYKEWTYCIIENKLYFYRQGDSLVYKLSPTNFGNPVTITSFTPSFLNMAGQMGIFRANGRLGFWDSANSISWSSAFDLTDFTPAIETLAGDVTFNDVLGRIVTIKASGSGFVIYSTKNIVGAKYATTGSILFEAHSIAEVAGIWISKQVCTGVADTEHYAYTNTGIVHISNGEKANTVFPGLYDFLKEAREPVYMDYLQGRYLFFNLIDPAYISGMVSFSIEHVAELTIRLTLNGGELVNPDDVPDLIDGIPFEDDLLDRVQNGGTQGEYGIWNATGSKMIPGRVSSMDPYELDDPFTPADDNPYAGNLAPLYTTQELIDARDSGTWTNKVSVDNTKPFALDLGWHDLPLGTGYTDDGLTRISIRQGTEWNEYTTLFNSVQSAIQLLAAGVTITYDATIRLPPSHGGPAYISTDTGFVGVGVLPDPTHGITVTSAFSGVGTYAPSYEYKKIFTKQYPIKRRVVASEVPDKKYIGSIFYCGGGGGVASFSKTNVNNWGTYTPWIPVSIPSPSYDAGIGPIYEVEAFNYPVNGDQTAVISACAGLISPTYTDGVLGALPFLFMGGYFYKGGASAYYGIVGDPSSYRTIFYHLYFADPAPLFSRKTTTTKTLQIGSSEAGSTVESKLVANQRIVDWGIWTVENPPAGFDWATNEQTIGDPGFLIPQSLHLPPLEDITYPGATFLLQNATTSPIYPDYAGALVYDIYLQKWGKFKGTYRTLVDYAPVNSTTEKIITYSNFGLDSGVLQADGSTRLFSSKVTDSFLRYGKIALFRQGFTNIEVITIKFRKPFTGSIVVDVSLDGRSLHSALTTTDSFEEVGMAVVYPPYAGKWFVLTIKGEFDIRSIEYNGNPSGYR